ncbi:hypothetical protein K2X33_11945 [bacterium]|nr:hypothetical protein [bacterium]
MIRMYALLTLGLALTAQAEPVDITKLGKQGPPTAADKAESENVAYRTDLMQGYFGISQGRSELLLKKSTLRACLEFAKAEVRLGAAGEALVGALKFSAASGGYFGLRQAQGLTDQDATLKSDYAWTDPLDSSITHTLHTKHALVRFAQNNLVRALTACRGPAGAEQKLDDLSKDAFDLLVATGDTQSAILPPQPMPHATLRGVDLD